MSEPGQAHHRRLEEMYHSAPCNQAYDPSLDVQAGRAVVEMPVEETMHHAAGAVHGAWVFKLLDDSAFFAANSLVEDTFVLTVNFDVHLIAPVTRGPLRGEAEVVHEGTSSLLADARVLDGNGDQVARGTGTFVKGRTPLDDIEGYAQADVSV